MINKNISGYGGVKGMERKHIENKGVRSEKQEGGIRIKQIKEISKDIGVINKRNVKTRNQKG